MDRSAMPERQSAEPPQRPRLSIRLFAWLLLTALAVAIAFSVINDLTRTWSEQRCREDLKSFSQALMNYHTSMRCLPPAYVMDRTGRRMHSWRSFVVPLLDWDYGASGIRYKFDEPWDGPYNTEYLDAYSKYFSCPAYGSSLRKASYLCVVGSPLWPIPKRIGEDWKNPSSSDNMREGGVLPNSGKALLLAEVVKSDIPWTKPDDISLAEIAKLLREDPSGDRFRRHIRRVVAVDAAKTIFILDPVKDIEEIKTLVESKLAGP